MEYTVVLHTTVINQVTDSLYVVCMCIQYLA